MKELTLRYIQQVFYYVTISFICRIRLISLIFWVIETHNSMKILTVLLCNLYYKLII